MIAGGIGANLRQHGRGPGQGGANSKCSQTSCKQQSELLLNKLSVLFIVN